MTRMRSLVLGSLVALAVTTTACGQAVDRLGNEPAQPVVLHAETGFNPDEVAPTYELALLQVKRRWWERQTQLAA